MIEELRDRPSRVVAHGFGVLELHGYDGGVNAVLNRELLDARYRHVGVGTASIRPYVN